MTGRFVPLSPPPDGLAAVVGEGRRRRRRRTAVTSTTAVTALAGVLALAVLAPGGGTDSLRPEPVVPAEQPSATPASDAPSPSGTPVAAPSPEPAASAPAAAASPDASPTTAPSLDPSPAPQPAPAGYRTPDLVRTHTGPPSSTRICGAAYSNDSSTGQVGWCVVPRTERTARGADLVVEVCRDGTTAGRLTYGTEHEVDLAVLEDGRTLWQWSAGRTPAEDSHELTAEPGGCWIWRAPWTGVDQRGEPLDSGSYVLRARSLADQLAEVPPADAPFTL